MKILCFGGGNSKLKKRESVPHGRPSEVQAADGLSMQTRKEKKEQSRMKELQARFDAVKKQRGELDKENKGLRSRIEALKAEIQEKNAEIQEATDKINTQEIYLNDIHVNIGHLEQELSPRDQQHIHSLSQPAIRVLERCLTKFHTLEKERDHVSKQYQEAIESLKKSHRDQLGESQERHEIEMAQKASEHDEKMRKLKSDHEEAILTLKNGHHEKEHCFKAEISRLEAGLLTTVDHFQPIPDPKLGGIFTDLDRLIVKFARPLADSDPGRLGELWKRSTFIEIAQENHHRFLIQSILWQNLVDGFFSTPFRVFGRSGDHFYETWQSLFRTQGGTDTSFSEWPRPDKASEKWRSITFETLRDRLESKAGASFGDEQIKKDYHANLSKVEEALLASLHIDSSYDRIEAIQNIGDIVKLASKIAFDFGTQRCRLEFFMPRMNQTTNSDASTYKDMNPGNYELVRGVIKLVVAPGLRRTGDGRGYSYRETVGICSASVYLKPSS